MERAFVEVVVWRVGLAPEHLLVVDLKTAETVLAPQRRLADASARRSAPLTALLRWLSVQGPSAPRRMPQRLELPPAEVCE